MNKLILLALSVMTFLNPLVLALHVWTGRS